MSTLAVSLTHSLRVPARRVETPTNRVPEMEPKLSWKRTHADDSKEEPLEDVDHLATSRAFLGDMGKWLKEIDEREEFLREIA